MRASADTVCASDKPSLPLLEEEIAAAAGGNDGEGLCDGRREAADKGEDDGLNLALPRVNCAILYK